MGRPPVVERMGVPKRGPWTPEEDIILVSYIQEHGPGNWRLVPNNAGLQRCGKSCRLRWKNYLRPGIKRGNFSPEEDRIIIRHQALLGNRWAAIAAHLTSRTDNDIKNYWHTHLKKKLSNAKPSSSDEKAKNQEAGNSITAPPQNNEAKKSIYDDMEIPPLTSIEKWLLEDPSAPVPQLPPVPAPSTEPGHEDHDLLLNMLTPFDHDQFPFGPFY